MGSLKTWLCSLTTPDGYRALFGLTLDEDVIGDLEDKVKANLKLQLQLDHIVAGVLTVWKTKGKVIINSSTSRPKPLAEIL